MVTKAPKESIFFDACAICSVIPFRHQAADPA
jgi:hypothetical protein